MAGAGRHRSLFTAEGEAKRQRRSYESAQWCRLLQQVLELQRTTTRLTPGVYQIDPGLMLKLRIQAEKLEPLLARDLE